MGLHFLDKDVVHRGQHLFEGDELPDLEQLVEQVIRRFAEKGQFGLVGLVGRLHLYIIIGVGNGRHFAEIVATHDDLALVGVKPELTYVSDQRIKRESPFRYTLVTTLVNGGAKYMADRSCYERCMYEAINSPFGPGTAERLAQTAVTMLQAATMN